MKLRTISTTYERLIQTKPYENVKVAITLEAQLEEGDDAELSVLALRTMARHNVWSELARYQTESVKATVESLIMGLPASVKIEEVEINEEGQ